MEIRAEIAEFRSTDFLPQLQLPASVSHSGASHLSEEEEEETAAHLIINESKCCIFITLLSVSEYCAQMRAAWFNRQAVSIEASGQRSRRVNKKERKKMLIEQQAPPFRSATCELLKAAHV